MTTRQKPGLLRSVAFGSPSAERDAVIERIIAATGEEPDNRDKLASNLFIAAAAFTMATLGRRANTAKFAKRVKRVRQTMKKLQTLIDYPQIREIGESLNLKSALAHLERLERINKRVGHIPEIGGQPSPLALLAGLVLPVIYEEPFCARASFRYVGGVPAGPVISFVEAVLTERGLRCGRHQIATSISRLRKAPKQREKWRSVSRAVGKPPQGL